MKEKIKLFLTAFVQVYLVAVQTVLLANYVVIGVGIIGFTISFVWSFNVKKVAFGTLSDRFVYAFGAGIGSVLGLLTTKLFI